MVDAHCHLYEVEDLAGIEDINLIICNGAGIETNKKAIEMANKYKNVYATAGCHPEEASSFEEINLIKQLSGNKVVAVGECGLDYYENTTEEEKERQKELFKINIKLAKEKKLPLVVHCRGAFEDVFKTLDYDKVQMHCFTGNEEQMRECVERGWYISFGGILTFKNSQTLREVAKKVPKEKLLTETDAPWLSPEPYRGEKNTPVRVKYILDCLQNIRNEKIEEIIEINARTLFKL